MCFFLLLTGLRARAGVAVVKENVAPFLHRYKAPLVGAMIRTFHNPAFRPLLIAWTLEGIGLSALVSMFPFYVRYFVVSDGEKAQQYALPLDPQVRSTSHLALPDCLLLCFPCR